MDSNKLYKKIVKNSLNYDKFMDLAKSVVENEVLVNAGEDTHILIEDFATNMAYGSAYTRNKYLVIGSLIGTVTVYGCVKIENKIKNFKKKDEEC